MKKTVCIAAVFIVVMFTSESQAGGRCGGYGYSSRGLKSFSSFKAYSAPAPRNYKSGGQIYLQNGYGKSNGTYVMPHYKTRPDNTPYNNLGAWGK